MFAFAAVLGSMALVIFRWPYIGLSITIASLPLVQVLPDLPFLTSFIQLAGGLTLAGYLAQRVASGRPIRLLVRPKYILGLLFLAIVLLSILASTSGFQGQNWLLTYFQLLVLTWLTAELLTSVERVRMLMAILLASILVSIGVGLWQDLPDSPISSVSVVKGLSKNRNLLALYAIWGAVFSHYFLATATSSRLKVLCVLALIMSVIGIIVTGSRTGFLVLPIVVAFLLVYKGAWNTTVRALPVAVIVFALIGFSLVALGPARSGLTLSARWERFTAIPATVASGTDTMGIRYETWRVAYLLWQQHPLVGIGAGRYKEEFRELSTLPIHVQVIVPHNMYMTLLAELGLFGLITWIGLVALTWRELQRVSRSQFTSVVMLAVAWQAVLLATLLTGITHDLHTSKLLWLVFGLGIVLMRQYRIVLERNKAHKEEITASGDFR